MNVSDTNQSVGQLLEKIVSTGFVYQFDPRRNCYPRDQSGHQPTIYFNIIEQSFNLSNHLFT